MSTGENTLEYILCENTLGHILLQDTLEHILRGGRAGGGSVFLQQQPQSIQSHDVSAIKLLQVSSAVLLLLLLPFPLFLLLLLLLFLLVG